MNTGRIFSRVSLFLLVTLSTATASEPGPQPWADTTLITHDAANAYGFTVLQNNDYNPDYVIAFWLSNPSGYAGYYRESFDNGATWGMITEAFTLQGVTQIMNGGGAVIDAQGLVCVVWTDFDGSSYRVQFGKFNHSSWVTNPIVSVAASGYPGGVGEASIVYGRYGISNYLHIAWAADITLGADGLYGFHVSSINGGSSWSGPHTMNFNSGGDNDEDFKFLAAGDDGWIYAIYSDNRNGWNSSDLYLCRSSNAGVNWQYESIIDNATYGNTDVEEKPNLVVSEGHLYLTYVRNHNLVFRASADRGATWGGIETIVSNGNVYSNAAMPMPIDFQNNLHLAYQATSISTQESFYAKTTRGGTILTSSQPVSNPDDRNTTPVGVLVNEAKILVAVTQPDAGVTRGWLARQDHSTAPFGQNALNFDGANDYVHVGDFAELEFNAWKPYTLEAWVKPRAGGDGGIVIGKFRGGGATTYYLSVGTDGRIASYRNVSPWVIYSTSTLSMGTYSHVAATYDGAYLRLFINGVECGIQYFSSNPGSAGTPVMIGAVLDAGGLPTSNFDGEMDEVRIYNYARSTEEIYSGMMTPANDNEAGLLAVWHFNESDQSGIALDGSLYGFDGMLMNAPTYVRSFAMRQLAPTRLQARAGNGKVDLTWKPGVGEGNIIYRVFSGTEVDGLSQIDSTTGGVNDTTVTIDGLENFQTYYFAVSLVDDTTGESARTNTVSAAPSIFVEVPSLPFVQVINGNFLWGDYDVDGDYDVFICGSTMGEYQYAPYELGVEKLYRNDDGVFSEVSAGFQQQVHRVSASWCDYNNDGLLDLSYMGSSGNGTRAFKLYRNNGDGTFLDIPTNVNGEALGSLAWGDYDNDGDQDVVVMGFSTEWSDITTLYRNDGDGNFTVVDVGLSGHSGGSCSWGDYDNDQDLDLLILGEGLYVYRNDDPETFTLTMDVPGWPNRGQAVWGDYDNDGDLDIIYAGAGGEGYREAGIYRNDGGEFSPIETNLDGVARSTVSVGDVDNDGDLDIFLAGDPGSSFEATSYLYVNEGEDSFVQQDISVVGVQGTNDNSGESGRPHTPGSALVDYDRDGDLDIMILGQDANYQAVTRLYENQGTVFNTQPTEPAGLTSVPILNDVNLEWSPSVDATTPQEALTYNIRVGSAPAGVDVMSPMAKVAGTGVGGGFRLVQQIGNAGHNTSWRLKGLGDGQYYWSVEAIDQVYRNSRFQAEASFIIDGPPSTPEILYIAAGVGSVELRWTQSTKSSVAKYLIYADVEPGMYTVVDSTSGGTADTAKVVIGLDNEVVYYFSVRAVDPAGNQSDYSNEVTARPSLTPGRIVVSNTASGGAGSFFDAVTLANTLSQADTIVFQIAPGSSIDLTSDVYVTTDFTIIDGDLNHDGTPDIRLCNRSDYGSLTIVSSNNLIKGLVLAASPYNTNASGGFVLTIEGQTAQGNRILGNHIGVGFNGLSNDGSGMGLAVVDGAHHNWIGDGTPGSGNIISSNAGHGVTIVGNENSTNGNIVAGNIIGLGKDGETTIPNSGSGIYLSGRASYNKIGIATPEGRNIIAANSLYGIHFEDVAGGHLDGNQILGNYIGTNLSGMEASPNSGGGVFLQGYNGGGAIEASITNTQIGDGTAGGRNVISGNGGEGGGGVMLLFPEVHDNSIEGNYIGLAADGTTILGNGDDGVMLGLTFNNTIANNVISGNAGDGMQLTYAFGTRILGNLIGCDATGQAAKPNSQHGVNLEYGSSFNIIGDGTVSGKNVISGNQFNGVRLWDDSDMMRGNKVQGNYIGTNAEGTQAIPNQAEGLIVQYMCVANEIGGVLAGEGNVIAGNLGPGIRFYSDYGSIDSTIIAGNVLGLGTDGSAIPNEGNGISVEGQVLNLDITKNIISANDGHGIYISDNGYESMAHRLMGNRIGTDLAGSLPMGNTGSGICLQGSGGYSTYQIRIGSGRPEDANLIAGNNEHGILITGNAAHENLIAGNFIGINAAGDPIPNGIDGIHLGNESYRDSIIGNIVSGNVRSGIWIENSTEHILFGNKVGTDPQGTSTRPNGGSGIYLYRSWNNRIGDGTIEGRNIVSGNGSHGIYFYSENDDDVFYTSVSGNYIGVAADGHADLGNEGSGIFLKAAMIAMSIYNDSIANNVIAYNSGDGITLEGEGVHDIIVHANSIHHNDDIGINIVGGAQFAIAPPTITDLDSSNVLYGETENSMAQIEVYVNGTDEEGEVYFGSTVADEVGNWSIPLSGIIGNRNITATQQVGGSTSGFSSVLTAPSGYLYRVSNVLDFGNVLLGDSLALSVSSVAIGNGVIVSGYELAFGSVFTPVESAVFPDTLFNGDTLFGIGQFKPNDFGAFSDTLLVFNNTDINPSKLTLLGMGAPGILASSDETIDFGTILAGDSVNHNLRLFAAEGFVTIDAISLGDTLNFRLETAVDLPMTMGVGDTIDLVVWFRPVSFGLLPDTLVILNNSDVDQFNISCAAAAEAGELVISGGPDFGSVLAFSDESEIPLKVFTAHGWVEVGGASLASGSHFTVMSSVELPYLLKEGDTIHLQSTFHPGYFGVLTDTVLIVNNSMEPEIRVAFQGIGSPGTFGFTPAMADFGTVLVGDSATNVVRFFATTGAVTWEDAAFDDNLHFFASGSELPDTLVAGDTIDVAVKFKPLTFGLLNDTARFIHNGTNVGLVKMAFSGIGGAGTLSSNVSTLNFGNTYVGLSTDLIAKVYPVTGEVVIDSTSLETGLEFSVVGEGMDGDTLEVTVRFTPGGFGASADNLLFHNNSSTDPFVISLSGTGIAGTLSSGVSLLDYGEVYVGDSASAVVAFYTTVGVVQLNSLELGLADFVQMNPPSLPMMIGEGDTLHQSVLFKPGVGGQRLDTLTAISNGNTVSVALSGSGKVNVAPNAFTLKPLAGNLTNDLTPTLSWQNTGDPDGDVLVYDVLVSKNSNLSSPVVNVTGINDSSFTTTTLDTVSLYYYRLTARDPRGASTSSNTGFFRTDGRKPSLAVGVLQLKAIKKDVQVYVATSEVLVSRSISFNLNGSVDDSHTLNLVDGQSRVYQTDYTIGGSGALSVTVNGTDSAGNLQNMSKDYTIATLSKGKITSLVTDGFELLALKGTVSEEGYLLASMIDRAFDEHLNKELGKSGRLGDGQEVLKIMELISTSDLQKGVEIKVSYEESLLEDLRSRYAGFDERKIGLYKEESDGSYTYVGGQGGSGQVKATTSALGRLVVLYDDHQLIAPKSVELSQNYPNPFNPTTTIRYGVPQGGRVKLVVYNVLGQVVSELVNKSQEAGYYEIVWNGRNNRNMSVSSGIYLYRLETPQGVVTRKMTFLK